MEETTLVRCVNRIRKENPFSKNMLEKVANVPIERVLSFVGRTVETQNLQKSLITNITSFCLDDKSKQNYRIDLVYGGVGLGKSRIAYEVSKQAGSLHTVIKGNKRRL